MGSNRCTRTKTKVKAMSGTKLAVATAFLGVSVLAAAAFGGPIKGVSLSSYSYDDMYGYDGNDYGYDGGDYYGYNEPAPVPSYCAYGFDSNGGYGFAKIYPYYCAKVSSQNECTVELKGKTFTNIGDCNTYIADKGLYCAYGYTGTGYGFSKKGPYFCSKVSSSKECTSELKGRIYNSLTDCNKYILDKQAVYCAYGFMSGGYGFNKKGPYYCAKVGTAKECTSELKGRVYNSLKDCTAYVSKYTGKK